MKFLLAGFGSIGRRHLRNLLALGEKDIVLLRSGRSTLPLDEAAGFPQENNLEAALAHKPDAVIIATPSALHLQTAIPAAKQGCALLLEKPVSSSLDGIEDLQKANSSIGNRMLVGFQFRFHPGLQFIRLELQKQILGRVLCARVHFGEYLPGWHPWEDYRQSYTSRADLGGGAALTQCHSLDYLRWLLGDVQALSAITGRVSNLQMDVEDLVEASLRFSNGAIGHMHLDLFRRPPIHTLEITTENGLITWDNSSGVASVYDAQTEKWEQYAPPADFERNVMFLDEMRHFIEVAKGLARPVCSLEDGIQVLKLSLAILQSSARSQSIMIT